MVFFHQSPIFHDTGQNKLFGVFFSQTQLCLQFQYTSFTMQHLLMVTMVFQFFVCNEKKYSHRGIENLIPSKITLQSVDLQFSITRI